jgi:hypothetical protein
MAENDRPGRGPIASLLRSRSAWGVAALLVGFAIGLLVSGKPWHLPPSWGDIPTWISAIATIGLLIGAVVTARYAIRAFHEQAKEVAILTEQNDRDIAERRRAQAARVFTCIPSDPPFRISPYAKNTSDAPVYEAQFWYTRHGGLTAPEDLGMIAPGSTAPDTIGRRFSEAEALERTILTFRDANTVRWIRMPDRVLIEQECDTTHDSVLAALGRPLPAPAGPAELPEQPDPPGDAAAPASQ